jgi:hypothetical protein
VLARVVLAAVFCAARCLAKRDQRAGAASGPRRGEKDQASLSLPAIPPSLKKAEPTAAIRPAWGMIPGANLAGRMPMAASAAGRHKGFRPRFRPECNSVVKRQTTSSRDVGPSDGWIEVAARDQSRFGRESVWSPGVDAEEIGAIDGCCVWAGSRG